VAAVCIEERSIIIKTMG